MKHLFKILLLLSVVFSFTSCKDDVATCIDDIVGNYTGNLVCGVSDSPVGFAIEASSSSDSQVIFKWDIGDIPAIIDDNCNYSIVSTSFEDPNFGTVTYTGSGSFSEGAISGPIILTSATEVANCDLNVTK